MKKLLLLCMVFVFSNTFFAQEVKDKKSKTEKAVKEKSDKVEKLKADKKADKKSGKRCKKSGCKSYAYRC